MELLAHSEFRKNLEKNGEKYSKGAFFVICGKNSSVNKNLCSFHPSKTKEVSQKTLDWNQS